MWDVTHLDELKVRSSDLLVGHQVIQRDRQSEPESDVERVVQRGVAVKLEHLRESEE